MSSPQGPQPRPRRRLAGSTLADGLLGVALVALATLVLVVAALAVAVSVAAVF